MVSAAVAPPPPLACAPPLQALLTLVFCCRNDLYANHLFSCMWLYLLSLINHCFSLEVSKAAVTVDPNSDGKSFLRTYPNSDEESKYWIGTCHSGYNFLFEDVRTGMTNLSFKKKILAEQPIFFFFCCFWRLSDMDVDRLLLSLWKEVSLGSAGKNYH